MADDLGLTPAEVIEACGGLDEAQTWPFLSLSLEQWHDLDSQTMSHSKGRGVIYGGVERMYFIVI